MAVLEAYKETVVRAGCLGAGLFGSFVTEGLGAGELATVV
jgi:hypothetical protein